MKRTYFLLGIALLAVITMVLGIAEPLTVGTLVGSIAIGTFAVADGDLRATRALPNGAANVTSTGIDLGHGTSGRNVADHEFLLTAPALTTGQLADTQTMTYAIVTSASSDMSSPTVINSSLLVQTGAGGAGAAASSARFRLPTNCQRYVGVRATKSGAGDASGASYIVELRF